VVTAAGIAVAVAGVAQSDAARAKCAQALCTPAGVSDLDAAHTKTTAGWIMVGIGAPVLVAGVVMAIVGASRPAPPSLPSARRPPVEVRAISVGLTPGGLALGGRF
jgi:hypothetical protein